MKSRVLLATALLLAAAGAAAHDGHVHADEAAAPAAAGARPTLGADGRLHVSKALQRALEIRTEPVAETPQQTLALTAEVLAVPSRPGLIPAPEAGRLERAGKAWPLPGQRVAAGEVLALLRPQMSQRERGRRRAAMAQIEQKLTLARINVTRLRAQTAGIGGEAAVGNVYVEQAEAELESEQTQLRLLQESLDGAVSLRAPAAGTLLSVAASDGDVVAAGNALFELALPGPAQLAVTVTDPGLAGRLRAAELPGAGALRLLGSEVQPGRPGWRLRLETSGPSALLPGQLVPVTLAVSTAASAPLPCNSEAVWVHVEPEWFERRAAPGCVVALAPGERRVTRGGALLEEYR